MEGLNTLYKVNFYLKSRNKIDFICEHINLTKNAYGELIEYEIDFGVSKNKLLYIDIKEIEGATIEELYGYKG